MEDWLVEIDRLSANHNEIVVTDEILETEDI